MDALFNVIGPVDVLECDDAFGCLVQCVGNDACGVELVHCLCLAAFCDVFLDAGFLECGVW